VYTGHAFGRITHTMIWTGDGSEQLSRLSYLLPREQNVTRFEAGLDGQTVEHATALDLHQLDTEHVTGSHSGSKVDGWLQVVTDQDSTFAAVRWPWQQYPLRIDATADHHRIDLFAPETPSGLTGYEMEQLDELKNYVEGQWDVPGDRASGGPISPRGISKTYELLHWTGIDTPSGQRNQLLQNPIIAWADPVFTARSKLPSPYTAINTGESPEIEAAIESFFKWVTARRVEQGDYGAWSFGEIQYDWKVHDWGPRLDRYWLNNGRGWSIVPWLMWMRSGERRYLDEAEQNSRHVMDLDISHVPEWDGAPDYKHRGGIYSYAPVQAGLGPGKTADRYGDTEYLGTYFYLTGYERAWDVLTMRKEALRRFDHSALFELTREQFIGDWTRNTYRTFGELAIAYEATHDPDIKVLAMQYLDFLMTMQREDGWMPGLTSNFYFSQPMNIAFRVFPERRQDIAGLLQSWVDFRGDVLKSGITGNVIAPMSLWTLRTLLENGTESGAHYPELAWRIMRTQTMGVHTTENDFQGFSGLIGHQSGWFLRDWLVALAMADEHVVDKTTWLPASHFHGRLGVTSIEYAEGWRDRTVAFILDESDQPISVASHYWLYNLGTGPILFRYRLYDPLGHLVSEMEAPIPTTPAAFDPATIDVEIPPDGIVGAYALEILGTTRVPVNLKTGGAKIVHAFNGSDCTVRSVNGAGMIYGMKTVTPTKFVAEFPKLEYIPRLTLYDSQDTILGNSRITGDYSLKQIVIWACGVFWSDIPDTVVGLLTQDTSHFNPLKIKGWQPYVSTSPEQWYDPGNSVGYDIEQFLDVQAREPIFADGFESGDLLSWSVF